MCQCYTRGHFSTGYSHCMTVHYAKQTSLEDKATAVYLIAVLMVLEACIVVHKSVEFLKTHVLLLCLQNRDETPVTVNKLLSILFPITEKNAGTLVERSHSKYQCCSWLGRMLVKSGNSKKVSRIHCAGLDDWLHIGCLYLCVFHLSHISSIVSSAFLFMYKNKNTITVLLCLHIRSVPIRDQINN